MKSKVAKQLRNRKRRLQHRLRQERRRRLFADQDIHYQYTEKVRVYRRLRRGTISGSGSV